MSSSSQSVACPVVGIAHGAFWREATPDVQDPQRSESDFLPHCRHPHRLLLSGLNRAFESRQGTREASRGGWLRPPWPSACLTFQKWTDGKWISGAGCVFVWGVSGACCMGLSLSCSRDISSCRLHLMPHLRASADVDLLHSHREIPFCGDCFYVEITGDPKGCCVAPWGNVFSFIIY